MLPLVLWSALADLPVHCLHAQIVGNWTFHVGKSSARPPSCGHSAPDRVDDHLDRPPSALLPRASELHIELRSPNLAFSHPASTNGASGSWTMVYDEGFEVQLGGFTYFAFSAYAARGDAETLAGTEDDMYVSHCDRTLLGWYRARDGSRWGCFYGERDAGIGVGSPATANATRAMTAAPRARAAAPPTAPSWLQLHGTTWSAASVAMFAAALNARGRGWHARPYTHIAGARLGVTRVSGLQRAAGGFLQVADRGAATPAGRAPPPRSAGAPRGAGERASVDLPRSLDWRRVDGINWDHRPVRTQGMCGSCYAIATIEMLEARLAIRSRGARRAGLSVASVTQCSHTNQGCDGGYPYLAAKHAKELGIADAQCFPDAPSAEAPELRGRCDTLTTNASCWVRASSYRYVGGYYGAGNEQEMKEALLGGPIVASFFVRSDFLLYDRGVYAAAHDLDYEEGGLLTSEDAPHVHPWRKTSHSVLVVGWGDEPIEDGRPASASARTRPYWIARNSWGPEWGEDGGYFRIARGSDECGFESMPVVAEPDLTDAGTGRLRRARRVAQSQSRNALQAEAPQRGLVEASVETQAGAGTLSGAVGSADSAGLNQADARLQPEAAAPADNDARFLPASGVDSQRRHEDALPTLGWSWT